MCCSFWDSRAENCPVRMSLSQGHCFCEITPVCVRIGSTVHIFTTLMRKSEGEFVLLGEEEIKAAFFFLQGAQGKYRTEVMHVTHSL